MIHPITSLPLSSRHRVSQIIFHPTQPYLAVQSHDRSVEIFRIRTEEEVRKKQARRKKRSKEKKKAKGEEEDSGAGDEAEIKLVDLFTPYLVVRAGGKIRSFEFGVDDKGHKGGTQVIDSDKYIYIWTDLCGFCQLFLALASNALEIHNIPQPTKSKEGTPEAKCQFTVDLPGHRTDVRTLSLSSDDQLLASASNGSLKIWNMKTTACIRTMDCGYAICSTFLPGDRHVRFSFSIGTPVSLSRVFF